MVITVKEIMNLKKISEFVDSLVSATTKHERRTRAS